MVETLRLLEEPLHLLALRQEVPDEDARREFDAAISKEQVGLGKHDGDRIRIHPEKMLGILTVDRQQEGAASAGRIQKGLIVPNFPTSHHLPDDVFQRVVGALLIFDAFCEVRLINRPEDIELVFR